VETESLAMTDKMASASVVIRPQRFPSPVVKAIAILEVLA
jgi:hypothetical protein